MAQNHTLVPSASLVPAQDPTLMFTNAGMVPFKNIFTGNETASYPCAVSVQKCLRAGGKHNDLENVGFTSRHQTFFEMLGNFSFGSYFKAETITMAWELLTKVFALPKEKLLVTVYQEDDESFHLWKKISGLPTSHILRIATSDNFWSMGTLGPCGPCSEIFYDHGEELGGGPPGSPNENPERFVEIWNLVFMQLDQITPEKRKPLPYPSIDTGMGLERISAILQNKRDNYDTDILRALIEASASLTNTSPDGEYKISHRIIADHIRAISFLIADGVVPNNEGRGHVLRRIMRRAMRHVHKLHGNSHMMAALVPVLENAMGGTYSELQRARPLILETINLEEERFHHMLDKGLKLLDEELASLDKNTPLAGEVAFQLYDTYGFPLDLTQDILREKNVLLQEEGFKKSMENHRAKAKAAWAGSGEKREDKIWFDLYEKFGSTEFLGYTDSHTQGRLLAIVDEKGAMHNTLCPKTPAFLLINQTPFYGESGGQVGDTGHITSQKGDEFVVTDSQKKHKNTIVHYGYMKKGTFNTGDILTLTIDTQRRADIKANHSATHLLHEALRRVLGPHVTQKGSLVTASKLRFDFSHAKALTGEEKAQVESMINRKIRHNSKVESHVMRYQHALDQGALALFGEKYAEEVRVLKMGENFDDGAEKSHYSVELCGGTHVERLGDIMLFTITSQSAVSSGIRRLEARTAEHARQWLEQRNSMLLELASKLKVPTQDLGKKIDELQKEQKSLKADMKKQQTGLLQKNSPQEAALHHETLKDLTYVTGHFTDLPKNSLLHIMDKNKKDGNRRVLAFTNSHEDKITLIVGLSQDMHASHNAIPLVQIGAKVLGGKGGGGRVDMAQAGGTKPDMAKKALAAIKQELLGKKTS